MKRQQHGPTVVRILSEPHYRRTMQETDAGKTARTITRVPSCPHGPTNQLELDRISVSAPNLTLNAVSELFRFQWYAMR